LRSFDVRKYVNKSKYELIITEVPGCLVVPPGGTFDMEPEMYLKMREIYGPVIDEAADPVDILGGKKKG